MGFPKSLLHKGDGSSSSSVPAHDPDHYVIDLQHLDEEPATNKMYEFTTTKNTIMVKINIPGCSKLETFSLHRTHVKFMALEEELDEYAKYAFIRRVYDGTIRFKMGTYNDKTISYKIEFGVLTITFIN